MEFQFVDEHAGKPNYDNVKSSSSTSTGETAAPSSSSKLINVAPSPIVVLVVGMAGAGKTTLMHRINLTMVEKKKRGYYINLDPACRVVPFAANIDIRDTINYKEVMKQYGLGPNGAILTSLNLFATRFDQVVSLLEKKKDTLDYIFVDTPGQIEAFTWSAGGQIIHELLASAFPTLVLYISDTPRCASPTTFMSNMLYASSVLYKSMLPMVVAFNKTDVVPATVVQEWMADFETFQEALDADKGEEYMGSFNRSMSLVMDEFYSTIKSVGVSAATGDGIEKLFEAFDAGGAEFQVTYLPELQRRLDEREARDLVRQEKDLDRLAADMKAAQMSREPK